MADEKKKKGLLGMLMDSFIVDPAQKAISGADYLGQMGSNWFDKNLNINNLIGRQDVAQQQAQAAEQNKVPADYFFKQALADKGTVIDNPFEAAMMTTNALNFTPLMWTGAGRLGNAAQGAVQGASEGENLMDSIVKGTTGGLFGLALGEAGNVASKAAGKLGGGMAKLAGGLDNYAAGREMKSFLGKVGGRAPTLTSKQGLTGANLEKAALEAAKQYKIKIDNPGGLADLSRAIFNDFGGAARKLVAQGEQAGAGAVSLDEIADPIRQQISKYLGAKYKDVPLAEMIDPTTGGLRQEISDKLAEPIRKPLETGIQNLRTIFGNQDAVPISQLFDQSRNQIRALANFNTTGDKSLSSAFTKVYNNANRLMEDRLSKIEGGKELADQLRKTNQMNQIAIRLEDWARKAGAKVRPGATINDPAQDIGIAAAVLTGGNPLAAIAGLAGGKAMQSAAAEQALASGSKGVSKLLSKAGGGLSGVQGLMGEVGSLLKPNEQQLLARLGTHTAGLMGGKAGAGLVDAVSGNNANDQQAIGMNQYASGNITDAPPTQEEVAQLQQVLGGNATAPEIQNALTQIRAQQAQTARGGMQAGGIPVTMTNQEDGSMLGGDSPQAQLLALQQQISQMQDTPAVPQLDKAAIAADIAAGKFTPDQIRQIVSQIGLVDELTAGKNQLSLKEGETAPELFTRLVNGGMSVGDAKTAVEQMMGGGKNGKMTETQNKARTAAVGMQEALDMLNSGDVRQGKVGNIAQKFGEFFGGGDPETTSYKAKMAAARGMMVSALSGANVPPSEYARFAAAIPEDTDEPAVAKRKMAEFVSLMNEFAQTPSSFGASDQNGSLQALSNPYLQ